MASPLLGGSSWKGEERRNEEYSVSEGKLELPSRSLPSRSLPPRSGAIQGRVISTQPGSSSSSSSSSNFLSIINSSNSIDEKEELFYQSIKDQISISKSSSSAKMSQVQGLLADSKIIADDTLIIKKANHPEIIIKGDQEFRDKILADLAKLEESETALGLFQSLGDGENPMAIQISKGERDEAIYNQEEKRCDVTLTYQPAHVVCIDPEKGAILELQPTHITLAHEFIHCWHEQNKIARHDEVSTTGYDVKAEQLTIGRHQGDLFTQSAVKEAPTYKITENMCREDFELSPRGGHFGIKGATIEEAIKELDEPANAYNCFRNSIQMGVSFDNFMTKNHKIAAIQHLFQDKSFLDKEAKVFLGRLLDQAVSGKPEASQLAFETLELIMEMSKQDPKIASLLKTKKDFFLAYPLDEKHKVKYNDENFKASMRKILAFSYTNFGAPPAFKARNIAAIYGEIKLGA